MIRPPQHDLQTDPSRRGDAAASADPVTPGVNPTAEALLLVPGAAAYAAAAQGIAHAGLRVRHEREGAAPPDAPPPGDGPPNLHAALAACVTSPPALVVLGLAGGTVAWAGFVRALVAACPATRALLLMPPEQRSVAIALLEAGAHAYVLEPFFPVEIARAAAALVRGESPVALPPPARPPAAPATSPGGRPRVHAREAPARPDPSPAESQAEVPAESQTGAPAEAPIEHTAASMAEAPPADSPPEAPPVAESASESAQDSQAPAAGVGVLASEVAHAVNNPLQVLALLAESGGADDDQASAMRVELERVRAVTEILGRYGHRGPPAFEDAPPSALVVERLDAAREAGRVRVTGTLPSGGPAARHDPKQVGQALDDVLEVLAAHATEPEPRVSVRIRGLPRSPALIEIALRCPDVALAAEARRALADQVVWSHDTTRVAHPGLAYAVAVADAHGGALTTHAARGGIVVALRLPRSAPGDSA